MSPSEDDVERSGVCRLVTRLTIEERMMQQTKKKMMLEHLVVHKMNTAADLKQVIVSLAQRRNAFANLLQCHFPHDTSGVQQTGVFASHDCDSWAMMVYRAKAHQL